MAFSSNIKIVGDGGIGSNLSLPLIKLLTYEQKRENIAGKISITIIDGDVVENDNLVRQSFIPQDVGSHKADITADYLNTIAKTLGADIDITSHNQYLNEGNVAELIQDSSSVFIGVDNYKTRGVIEKYSKSLKNILLIFGGNEYDDGDVNVFLKINDELKTPEYSSKHPEIFEKEDKSPDEIGCEEDVPQAPQLLLANMAVAQFMLEAFYQAAIKGSHKWHERFFDIKQGKIRTIA